MVASQCTWLIPSKNKENNQNHGFPAYVWLSNIWGIVWDHNSTTNWQMKGNERLLLDKGLTRLNLNSLGRTPDFPPWHSLIRASSRITPIILLCCVDEDSIISTITHHIGITNVMFGHAPSKNYHPSLSRICTDSFTIHGPNICSKNQHCSFMCQSDYNTLVTKVMGEGNRYLAQCQWSNQDCGRNGSTTCPLMSHRLNLDRRLEYCSEVKPKQYCK